MRAARPGSGSWIAYVDAMTSILACWLMIALMLNMIPRLKAEEQAKQDGIVPGRMCVTLYWPDDLDIDIDLWGRSPDGKVVGYSSKSAPMMDLLRDDLGFSAGSYPDPSGKNFEMICSRALAKGSWTFNAQFYGDYSGRRVTKVPLKLVVEFPQDPKGGPKQTPITTSRSIPGPGEEITLADFDLDDKGHVVRDSVNQVDQPLRSNRDASNGQ